MPKKKKQIKGGGEGEEKKKTNKSGAEKRRLKRQKQSSLHKEQMPGAELDPTFQFGELDNHQDMTGNEPNTSENLEINNSMQSVSNEASDSASEIGSSSLPKRTKAQKRADARKRKKEAQLSSAIADDAAVVATELPATATAPAPSTNGLTAGDDFISLNFGDSDDEAPSEQQDVDDEKPTVFASIASKLGKFVQESIDPLKRKRNENGDSKKTRKRKRAHIEADPYPWLQNVNYSKENEPTRILHRELLDFVKFVGPTEEEHRVRTFVISRIQKLVEKKWPTAALHVFGSFETKLYLPTSDIDLVILSGAGGEVYEKPNHLRKLANWLVKARIAENIQVITSARVPIIKFIDSITKINVDISFNKPSGLVAAKVVKQYTEKMPALRPLVVFIKHFLNMRGMNEVYLGGLGSYSIICMVISFLQRHPKVATGQILQEENLGVLVVEFFELYGKRFNYDNVGININGQGCYFSKLDYGWQRPGQQYLLSIEDPTDPENDIAKSSFGILKVKSTLGGGHDFLVQRLYDVNDRVKEKRRADVGLDSILSSVVSIDEEMKEAREFIATCFESEVVQSELERMEASDGEIHETPAFGKSAKSKKDITEFVEEDDSEDSDMIDYDGHTFVRPQGYQKPSNPADVDDLYKKLNGVATEAASTKISSQPNGNSDEQVYVIESSDDEAHTKKTGTALRETIDLDSEEDVVDSRSAQVDKSARTRYWEAKGHDTTSVDRESGSD